MKKFNHTSRLELISISLAIFLLTSRNFCQVQNSIIADNSWYSLGVKVELNDFHIRDNYISPDPLSGILVASEISFQAKLNKALHSIEIFYSAGSPDSKRTQVDASQRMGCLSYSYSHSVNSWSFGESTLDFSLVAGISSFVMYTDLIVNSQIGGGKSTDQSWYRSHSLNIFSGGDYSFSEHQNLSVQFVVPVFKIVSRPNNGHWLDQNLKMKLPV
jgi:hypothetical protein